MKENKKKQQPQNHPNNALSLNFHSTQFRFENIFPLYIFSMQFFFSWASCMQQELPKIVLIYFYNKIFINFIKFFKFYYFIKPNFKSLKKDV